jgi:hypothetical protein
MGEMTHSERVIKADRRQMIEAYIEKFGKHPDDKYRKAYENFKRPAYTTRKKDNG